MRILSEQYEGIVPTRLDKAVYDICLQNEVQKGLSRSLVKQWIEKKCVEVNGEIRTKAGFEIHPGASLIISVPDIESENIIPDDIALNIIFEDNDILVLNKPAGLVVHPGAGIKRGTLANALAAHFQKKSDSNIPERMGIVHRLDKDTSGTLIVAKTQESLNSLGEQFSSRRVEKNYCALVFSTPRSLKELATKDEGTVNLPIGRHPTVRTKMAVIESGRHAVTHWKVIERFHYGALLDVKIETGRTHQIRVHMEQLKSPIIGDFVYGKFEGIPQELLRASKRFSRIALHAARLTVDHPTLNERMTFESPMPSDFLELIKEFRQTTT